MLARPLGQAAALLIAIVHGSRGAWSYRGTAGLNTADEGGCAVGTQSRPAATAVRLSNAPVGLLFDSNRTQEEYELDKSGIRKDPTARTRYDLALVFDLMLR